MAAPSLLETRLNKQMLRIALQLTRLLIGAFSFSNRCLLLVNDIAPIERYVIARNEAFTLPLVIDIAPPPFGKTRSTFG